MQRKEKDNRPLRRLVVYSLNGGKINVFCLHFFHYSEEKTLLQRTKKSGSPLPDFYLTV